MNISVLRFPYWFPHVPRRIANLVPYISQQLTRENSAGSQVPGGAPPVSSKALYSHLGYVRAGTRVYIAIITYNYTVFISNLGSPKILGTSWEPAGTWEPSHTITGGYYYER